MSEIIIPDNVKVMMLQGQQGEAGVSPILTETEIDNGYRVNIEDASGEHYFDLHNGTSGDYSGLTNKPAINGHTLASGNQTGASLGLASSDDVYTKVDSNLRFQQIMSVLYDNTTQTEEFHVFDTVYDASLPGVPIYQSGARLDDFIASITVAIKNSGDTPVAVGANLFRGTSNTGFFPKAFGILVGYYSSSIVVCQITNAQSNNVTARVLGSPLPALAEVYLSGTYILA